MKNIKIYLVMFAAIGMIFAGCNATRTTKGGAIGAGAGGVVGGVIGNRVGNTAAGAIIGAAVGGSAGAVIGRRMDKQAEELERELGKNAQVERVGEGIKVTFDAGILFATNSAELQPAAKREIDRLAATLQKYPGTNIVVEGHTDNTGSREINQPLSERRARSVVDYAASQGVERSRMKSQGYAFDQPIADNSTAAGRQQNRRVEVAIFASEEMKKAAERGEL